MNDVRIVTYSGRKGLFGRILQLRLLYKTARSVGADVYHCNELDSWLVGLALKVFHGASVLWIFMSIIQKSLLKLDSYFFERHRSTFSCIWDVVFFTFY